MGGSVSHQWAFGEDKRNRRLMEDSVGNLGAVIAGRETYESSVPWCGANGPPTGPSRRPVIVVAHEAPKESPEGGVYTFVTDGIESAVEKARKEAKDQDVTVMGGASIGQQYIVCAGLIRDRIREIRRLNNRIADVEKQIAGKVNESGTTLTELQGIGFVIAAKILGEVDEPARIRSKGVFAMLTGTAPLGARICAAAWGAQIEVSSASAGLLSSGLEDITLRSLGDHTLKDIDKRVELFQVDGPGPDRGLPRPAHQGHPSHQPPPTSASPDR